MSDTNPPDSMNTNVTDVRYARFENAWLNRRADEPLPRWQDHLPADDEPSNTDLVYLLLQVDIECRVKAGLPALLAERYFEHPRLQKPDARLDAEQQVKLIHWEYMQRWQKGDRAQRDDYQAAFPQHADAVRELKPRSRCPRCQHAIILEERAQAIHCPHCGSDAPLSMSPPDGESSGEETPRLDLRGYELIECLGKGGMGEVYRSDDPALGRDLAIKVMAADLRGDAKHERRFLREARVTGFLQHPGIVPVYNLGRFADGRLHYTMRLVRGRTFAAILTDEAGQPERMPNLLTIFVKICQAVAYAHSKRVIHRDLKPANVMVGRFGEVQVMDWGLAKVLNPEERVGMPEESAEAVGTVIPTDRVEGALDLSRLGRPMGTPAYMPPEQGLGEWDTVDERADVFALGAMLCEILTGQPPYTGLNVEEALRKAKQCDVAEALKRLEHCGTDEALTALCRECLASEREARPRDADEVAKRVASYQAEVQERLRRAELERVAAQTRAQEERARTAVEQERTREALARVVAERRARQRLLALAAAVLLLVLAGVAATWRMRQERDAAQARQERADHEALTVLEHGRERLDEGWRLHELAILKEAKAEAERAADIARGASDAVEQQAAAFRTEAQERLGRAEKNRNLLNALVDIATPHETKTYADRSGQVMALAEPSVEEQYAAAFRRRWPDVDVDKQEESVVAARLHEEPEVVLQGVIAGLDGWMLERRRQKRAEAEWRRLFGLVERLDPSEPRRRLRALLIGAVPPRAEEVAGLLGGRPPLIALWELGWGNDWRRLRQLRGQMDASAEPVLTVLLLAQASSGVGDMEGAEAVLRQALARRPDEEALLDALGKVLERQSPSRLVEAIGCYRAARARSPRLGVALSRALGQAGQAAEGEAVLRDLLRQQPNNPEMLFYLGYILNDQGKSAEAEEVNRKAIALKPDLAEAYVNLGVALNDQEKSAEVEAACRKAIALKPDLAEAYNGLGSVLNDQGKSAEAEAACRKAIALKPDLAEAYAGLGAALDGQGKPVEAEAACRKAIALQPDYAMGYNNLGVVLNAQGKPVESEAACRKAIALKPDLAEAYAGLGFALYRQGKPAEAEPAYRKAIDLKPNRAEIYVNFGPALRALGKHAEAEAICRKAIALKPDHAMGYNNLGVVLNDQGKAAESEAACRKAIALKPNLAEAYNNLGIALSGQGKHAKAEAAYRKAIALNPDDAEAYNNLGSALGVQGKYAEAAFRKAIALKPDDALTYVNLGNALYGKGKFAEAEAAYRKATALKPDFAEAYNTLGGALGGQGKYAEAEAVCRKAIALKTDFAGAYCNLAVVLKCQGQFSESLAAYRLGHELGSKQSGWRYPSLQWIREAERLVELEKKLPAILHGEALPANADDANTLAWMCQQHKKRHVAAARLYAAAFAAESKLFPALQQQHRYNAACSAVLAAAGQGEDAYLLPDKVVAMFRHWALGWLRADLKAYAQFAGQNNPAVKQAVQQQLAHWRRDPDLASVRNPKALDSLPDNERAAWLALWRDMDELAKRVAKKAN